MTLEELQRQILALRTITNDELGKMQHALDELKKQPQQPQAPKLERWKPKETGRYFIIDSFGSIYYDIPLEPTISTHLDNFNCFQTEAEAKQEALRTRARRKLEWLARELNKQRTFIGKVWTLFCFPSGEVVFDSCSLSDLQLGAVYFYDNEDMEYAFSQMTAQELEALR